MTRRLAAAQIPVNVRVGGSTNEKGVYRIDAYY